VKGDCVGVVPQGGGWVAVPQTGLRLQKAALTDELGSDSVAEPVQGRPLTPAMTPRRRNLCDNASAVTNRSRAGVGANSQSASGTGPRSSHDNQCNSTSAAVVDPSVSRRVRFDLVVPTTPSDTPR
jgi:hypothetical protein